MWANASLDPICFVENDRGQVLDTKLRGEPKAIKTLDALLAGREWLVQGGGGKEASFGAADVAVASYVLYVLMFFPQVKIAPKWPHLAQYCARAASRPAYARAFGSDLAAQLADSALRT